MPFESPGSPALTTFAVKVNGSPVPGEYGVLSLEIMRQVGAVPYAHIVLQDGDPALQTFAISEAAEFVPGAEISIDLGYENNEETVFKGVVTRQRIEAPARGSSRLHIEAKHPCFRMAHARKSRIWIDGTDADALSDLAAAQGIAFDGAGAAKRPQLVQHQASDWDFAVLRAERIGQVLLATDDGLSMFAPDPAASPETTLEYGINLFGFDLELDAERQPTAVEVGAWGAADQEVATAESAAGDVAGPGDLSGDALGQASTLAPRLRHAGARDQAELDEWAAAETLRRRLAAVTGTVEAQGSAAFAPGLTVELKGMGARFNGVVFVSGVRHMMTRGDWRTTLQVGLDPGFHDERHDVSAPPAAGLAPAISGLQIGVVDALEGDPAGEERVAVLLASETESQEPIWARPLSIGGGADRGLVMLPEVRDECLLGFLNGDPRDAVLIGGLHSSAAANPLPGADDNHVKGLVSRAGMKITFDDDGVALTLETPNGNKATLSDDDGGITLEDESGDTVKMSSDGVAVDSQSDVKIKAVGDVTIEGVNVTLKAQAEAKVEGSAGAKLESSGQAVVKGSVVMIN